MSERDSAPHGQRSGPEEKRLQGHWLLAKMGKKVLRPGGIELTRRLISHAQPSHNDRIVEFGPGVGKTADLLLECNPANYIGIDPNTEGEDQLLAILEKHAQARLVHANAKETTLPDNSCDLVVGEAMLTMHSNEEKLEIMAEAFRILAPGGRYAIHELGFQPDDVDPQVEKDVARALSRTIKVGARPLTMKNWKALLLQTGFVIDYEDKNPMHLLEPKRLIADEGIAGAARFVRNVKSNPAARERILAMRSVFRANRDNLTAVAFVARKPE
ncbi:MAG: methyltransferase domain-containing protein [Actinomycetaceae bacterium]|nr:methyltransferase domain-containing protein [Actinomycetaceae bacterium]